MFRKKHYGNISYNFGASNKPLIGKTIGQLLEEKAELHPDKDAVIVSQDNVRLTFEQLLEQVFDLDFFFHKITLISGRKLSI